MYFRSRRVVAENTPGMGMEIKTHLLHSTIHNLFPSGALMRL